MPDTGLWDWPWVPDGSLYISESEHGKIWRVMYKGDKKNFGPEQLAQMETRKKQPHIRTPHRTNDNLTPLRVEAGAKLYNTYCGSCHMSSGKGDGVRFPPIDGSEWVKGDEKRLIGVVLNGLKGPIEVNGKPFDGEMPPMDYLDDKDIAEILTYIRKEFGDDSPPVSTFAIKSHRYYTKKAKGEIN